MEGSEGLSEFFGIMALLFFLTGNAYYPARQLARRFTTWTQETARFFRKYLKVHIALNLAALAPLLGHAYYAEESNPFLWGSLISTFWLTVVGLMMHYKVPPGMGRQLRLLHSQQIAFLIWLAMILLGHILVE